MDPALTDKRAFPRMPMILGARCYGKWGSSPCLMSEISEAGVSFVSEHVYEVGEELTVAWRLDSSQPLQCVCRVSHITSSTVGAKFVDVDNLDRLRLIEFLLARGLRPNRNKLALENVAWTGAHSEETSIALFQ